MPAIRTSIASVLLTALAVGCSNAPTESVACSVDTPAVVSPALHAEVWDSVTSLPAAVGAVVWYRHRFIRDSLRTSGLMTIEGRLVPFSFVGGLGVGAYQMEVRKPGYHTWTSNASVRQGRCGLITTSLVVRLVPLPAIP